MSSQSIDVSICLSQDTLNTTGLIIQQYLIRMKDFPNLLVLVEEPVYRGLFLQDWKAHFKQLTGEKDHNIKIDTNCISMKEASTMSGSCINISSFCGLQELKNLLSQLTTRISLMTVWSTNHSLAREICLSHAGCKEFWIDHLPISRLKELMCRNQAEHFRKSMQHEMDISFAMDICLPETYRKELDQIRKSRNRFLEKEGALRSRKILQLYLELITRFKSTRHKGTSVESSLSSMQRFLRENSTIHIKSGAPGESVVETILKPVGVAALIVKSEQCVKSKVPIVEFIFKNLLIGNGVLLVCSESLLGPRFLSVLRRHRLPLRLIDPATVTEEQVSSSTLTLCPEDAFAVEFEFEELTSEKVNALILSLGVKETSIWYPDGLLQSKKFVINMETKLDENENESCFDEDDDSRSSLSYMQRDAENSSLYDYLT